jgi:DNA polymerase
MLTLSACIRGLVVPSPGCKFVVIDYAAIEARVLMWAAGQEDAVAAFHRGEDQYISMAEFIYKQKGFTKDKNPKERFLGKVTILGSGFGMGHIKFQATCEAYGINLGEKTECVERENKTTGAIEKFWYSPLAKLAVDGYRAKYSKVPEFWYGMGDAALMCIKTGRTMIYGKFKFSREREFLYLELPSGRRLAYHRPGVDKDGMYYYTEDTESFNYVKKRTYGGRLVENAIQATARDILAHGILAVEEEGFPVVMTVHDENVIEVPLEFKNLDNVIKIMCDLPAWATSCPIDAEGFMCERYRKG